MARKPTISYSEIRRLLDKGWTQTRVAQEYGLTRAAISKQVRQYEPKSPREEAMEKAYPWKLSPEHTGSFLKRVTRDHLDWVANGSIEGVSERRLTALRKFYKRLQDYDVVLSYSPDTPPSIGIPLGGFAYLPRQESDGDLIIRVDDYTNIDNKTKKFWRMPETLP